MSEDITIKKSTYGKIVIGVIVAVAVAAFFGGYFVGTQNFTDAKMAQNNQAPINIKDFRETLGDEALAPKPIMASIDDDPVKGDQNAPVTIIEFSDFECPFCAKFYFETLPLIEKNYVETGKVKLVFRDFPIQQIHPNAIPAAIASECADDQGEFWPYHDKVFETQKEWNKLDQLGAVDKFKAYAVELGLDASEFDECLESAKHINEVSLDYQEGVKYGVSGTPAFFVGNDQTGYVKVEGAKSFASFASVIDSKLNQ